MKCLARLSLQVARHREGIGADEYLDGEKGRDDFYDDGRHKDLQQERLHMKRQRAPWIVPVWLAQLVVKDDRADKRDQVGAAYQRQYRSESRNSFGDEQDQTDKEGPHEDSPKVELSRDV